MSTLNISQLHKHFDDFHAIRGINLSIEEGEFVVFVGPSGCGKSTLLRLIAGLEDVSGGNISLGDRDITQVPAAQRDLAMVFQSYALYPHMNVAENMSFALRLAGASKEEIAQKVADTAAILQLEPLLDRKPKALSGGQRQRVAIGRAIVRHPSVFLFDEPLSNLDAALRVQMRQELAALHQRLKATMIYVTHDQVEAMTLADKVVILNAGQVEQVGSPMEVYYNPESRFVAEFIGTPKMNFFPMDETLTSYLSDCPKVGRKLNTSAWIGARPESIMLDQKGLFGVVTLVERLGAETLIYLAYCGEHQIAIRASSLAPVELGETIEFGLNLEQVHGFDDQGHRLSPAITGDLIKAL
jgi:multiple sugar transport system ATP-binding protein